MAQELLLGKWFADHKHEGARELGPVSLDFQPDGKLTYTIHGEKEQVILLAYRVEGDVIVTDQPSKPRVERSSYRIEDGALRVAFGGKEARFLRREALEPEHDQVRRAVGGVFVRALAAAKAGRAVDIRKELLLDVPDMAERVGRDDLPNDVLLSMALAEEYFEVHADLGECPPVEPLMETAAAKLSAGRAVDDDVVLRFGFVTGRMPFEDRGLGAYLGRVAGLMKLMCGFVLFIIAGRLVHDWLGTIPLVAYVLLCGGLLLRAVRSQE